MTARVRTIPALGLALFFTSAHAQDQPADTPPTTPVLVGPTVEAEATRPTLIRVGYDGRLERLTDIQPEVAALDLVELDPGVRERIDRRLADRAAFLDRAVVEHYRTLLALYSAFAAGNQQETIRLYIEFTSHLAPLFEGGGLARQLASEMPTDQRRAYTVHLRDYYAAVVSDALEHPDPSRPASPGLSRAEVLRNYKIELLMEEVGRSFARIIQDKTDQVEDALAALRLTTEREQVIRAKVEVYGQELGLNPTPAQQREFFQRLMADLTPTERQRLMAWVLR